MTKKSKSKTVKRTKRPLHAVVMPVGPSSDDFQDWMAGRPDMKARIEAKDVNEHVAYEIWRSAWLACEREHKIRA